MTDTIVEVEQGKLRGKISRDYKGGQFYSFQGIPYAKSPLGELRFKAPVPPESWKGVREATEVGNASLSRHFYHLDKIVGSEDCLYLNVYTPQLPDHKKTAFKPVMFWIHGGGFVNGSGDTEIHGPEILMTGDVVLVTINYRLGILGFLKVEGPTGIFGNAGLKDMVLALKWVQKNICKFGGDPKNVTIFGESAGGCATHCLLLSPMANGLFHRAISQSGSALNWWALGAKNAADVAKVLAFESDNQADILKFLKSVPAEKIVEAQDKIPDVIRADTVRSFSVTIENDTVEPMFFSKDPLEIIKSGNYNKVPFMIGYTSREGMYFEIRHKQIYGELKLDIDFETKIPYSLNVPKGTELSLKIAKKIKEAYFGSSQPTMENVDNFFQLETDSVFASGIYEAVKQHLKNINSPIYFYSFSADTGLNYSKILHKLNHPGACHADDLGYLFKTNVTPEIKANSVEDVLIQKVVKLWTNFARNGNPNPVEKDALIKVTWKPTEKDNYNCLNIGTDLTFGKNPDLERMKVWEEIETIVANAKQQ